MLACQLPNVLFFVIVSSSSSSSLHEVNYAKLTYCIPRVHVRRIMDCKSSKIIHCI